MDENSPICEDCWLYEMGECPSGQLCAAYDMIIANKQGRKIFNSHFYVGSSIEDEWLAQVRFKNIDDYNDFLNWWVLGKFTKAREEVMRGLVTAKAPLSSEDEKKEYYPCGQRRRKKRRQSTWTTP